MGSPIVQQRSIDPWVRLFRGCEGSQEAAAVATPGDGKALRKVQCLAESGKKKLLGAESGLVPTSSPRPWKCGAAARLNRR